MAITGCRLIVNKCKKLNTVYLILITPPQTHPLLPPPFYGRFVSWISCCALIHPPPIIKVNCFSSLKVKYVGVKQNFRYLWLFKIVFLQCWKTLILLTVFNYNFCCTPDLWEFWLEVSVANLLSPDPPPPPFPLLRNRKFCPMHLYVTYSLPFKRRKLCKREGLLAWYRRYMFWPFFCITSLDHQYVWFYYYVMFLRLKYIFW